jgi:hypothetical protein
MLSIVQIGRSAESRGLPAALTSSGVTVVQLIKLTQNPCRIRLPKMKSANARSELILRSSSTSPLTVSIVLVVAFLAPVEAPAGGRSEVCMRREAVSTNWPTAEQKPERKALKGCRSSVSL